MEIGENDSDNGNDNKKKKEGLFSFTRLNKYFIIPFICPIICMISNYFLSLMMDQADFDHKQFFLTTFVNMSFVGGGLMYFVSWIRNKTDETRDNAIVYKERQNTSQIKFIYNDNSIKFPTFTIFFILLLISICLAIFNLVDIYSLDRNIFEERLYFLFFISFFSKIILKIDIFSHQVLSLFIGSIGLILLFIPIALIIEKEDIIINICMFFASIAFSLFLVLIKYLTHYYFISPFLCILSAGAISVILNTIGFMIYSLIKNGDLSIIKENFEFKNITNKTKLIGYSIITFVSASILQMLSNLVVYYFTPTLLMVTDCISPMLLWLFLTMPNEDSKINIIFNICGYIISLFSSLIYNEIIIFNFCDFNKNTKKYIEERQREELISLKDTENKINNSNLTQNENENETDTSVDEEND